MKLLVWRFYHYYYFLQTIFVVIIIIIIIRFGYLAWRIYLYEYHCYAHDITQSRQHRKANDLTFCLKAHWITSTSLMVSWSWISNYSNRFRRYYCHQDCANRGSGVEFWGGSGVSENTDTFEYSVLYADFYNTTLWIRNSTLIYIVIKWSSAVDCCHFVCRQNISFIIQNVFNG